MLIGIENEKMKTTAKALRQSLADTRQRHLVEDHHLGYRPDEHALANGPQCN